MKNPSFDVESKVAFLSRPDAYPDATRAVDVVETHMSWLFLTERYAYKLKKPVQTPWVDLRDVRGRLRNCVAEVRLNRRLSTDVYLGAVPLLSAAGGALTLTGEGDVADWLVKMRRLPADRMLDRLIRDNRVRKDHVESVVDRLYAFYRHCAAIEIAPAEYRGEFATAIDAHAEELCRPANALPVALIERTRRSLFELLARRELFDARVRAGRIVEGHGDLRPEHVCVQAETQVIDCLEFSRRLRTLDVVDELGFLALECERLGAPQIGLEIIDLYRRRNGDAAPGPLVDFYQGFRALVRATLAVRHLQEASQDPAKWRMRARHYLELACAHLAPDYVASKSTIEPPV